MITIIKDIKHYKKHYRIRKDINGENPTDMEKAEKELDHVEYCRRTIPLDKIVYLAELNNEYCIGLVGGDIVQTTPEDFTKTQKLLSEVKDAKSIC